MLKLKKVNVKVICSNSGETAANKEGRLQGQIDVPLNALGENQARRVQTVLSC